MSMVRHSAVSFILQPSLLLPSPWGAPSIFFCTTISQQHLQSPSASTTTCPSRGLCLVLSMHVSMEAYSLLFKVSLALSQHSMIIHMHQLTLLAFTSFIIVAAWTKLQAFCTTCINPRHRLCSALMPNIPDQPLHAHRQYIKDFGKVWLDKCSFQ